MPRAAATTILAIPARICRVVIHCPCWVMPRKSKARAHVINLVQTVVQNRHAQQRMQHAHTVQKPTKADHIMVVPAHVHRLKLCRTALSRDSCAITVISRVVMPVSNVLRMQHVLVPAMILPVIRDTACKAKSVSRTTRHVKTASITTGQAMLIVRQENIVARAVRKRRLARRDALKHVLRTHQAARLRPPFHPRRQPHVIPCVPTKI